ncbi:hypothetical protein FO439_03870 [Weissella cibaria]|uniref:hypothetical protein n=1 Tax=Weissella cibaria TaxID=137591 RepID=UPI0011917D30|nr:hypothetical protein [Weissella cibaria]TVV35789.1 hypothetical protein FO439_03870 [Weissella cibaria]
MNSIVSDANGTKQTISDLQTVQGKQSGDIATLQSRADGFEATVTKVNNLSVGGRNLLLGTSASFTGIGNNSTNGNFDDQGGKFYLAGGKKLSDLYNQYGPSQYLTLSFDWEASGDNISGQFNPQWNDMPWGGFSERGAIKPSNTNKSGHFKNSVQLNYGGYSTGTATAVQFRQDNLQGNITISNVKLESGNVATDWSPAPEDLSSATAKAQLTADNATLSINNYKKDADQRISKAQADIKVNADAITQKVSQSDYNAKTGELTQSVSKAQQTADTATQTIGTYKESNDKRVSAAETNITANADAIKLTASKTELNEATGKLSGDISTLQQRADGFDATVTKVNNLAVGGRNLLQGTGTASGDVAHGGALVKGAFNGYDAVKTNTAWNERYINLKSALGRTNAKSGDWYTISVYVKADKQIDTGSLGVYRAIGNGDANTNDGFIGSFQMSNKPITTQWQQYSWSFQINNISLQRQSTRVEYSSATDDNWIYWAGWKLERGNLATDWTPAPEDVDAQIAQVKITADGVYQTVNDPQTGLNTRVSTAEGNISKVQGTVDGMSNTVTQTANGLTQEIADRKTGDSNTLQAGKDFTTSQITSYDTGIQSQITQVSDGIMASVSATNLIVDSSFVNAFTNWTLSGDVSWKIDNEIMRKGVRVATFNNGSTNFDRKTSTLTSTPIYTMNLGGTQFYASFDLYAKSFGASAYFKAEIVQKDSSGSTTKSTPIGGSFDTGMSGWNNYMADITLDSRTTSLYLQFTQYGGGVVSVSRPYLGSTKLPAGAYMPGASNDNSSILKLFNNFFAFGIQSNTGALIAGINGDSSGLNIVGEKITITGDTTFIGNNFMDGALIKNASIGTAQIADVSITNAKIASLDVNKISGNVSNFIQSNWNGKYGSTTIDANGMKVDTNGVNTQFGSSGMALNMTGESIGGIGVQGFAGKPSDYQGLTFWLDGNAEYMAWGARDNGVTSGNPITKLGWFRSGSNPIGTSAGFNFDDDVIFNKNINIPGGSTKMAFSTTHIGNYDFAVLGEYRGRSGIAYGLKDSYLVIEGTYYNLSKVIMALSGLGAVKIPSVINSDGTVAKWFNVTL